MRFQKKLISHFDLNVFSIVVWTTYSFCFATSAEKSSWTKIYCMENCLNTQYLLLECCLLYSAVEFFAFFNKSDGGFCWNGLSIYVFTNPTRNATRCNNRGDLLHLTPLGNFQYFPRAIYNPVKHLWWSFYYESC